jgi:hypothetical protein
MGERKTETMSDTTITPAPTTITVDPGAPKGAPVPAPQTAPQSDDQKPHWLDARLERERIKALKEAGFESAEEAKKASDELKAKREAEKTIAQKAAELENSLKATKAEKDAAMGALGTHAKAQLAALDEAQRNAVMAVAGDDPVKQLTTIEALRPTWASAAAPAAAPTAPTVKDTAPAVSAPKDGPNAAPPDPKAIHAELKKTNPVLAARYALENGIFS